MSRRITRKRLGTPAALIIAAAIVASGSWAWYDFTQNYSNTFRASSEADYDPILIDEFVDPTRDYDGWVLNEDVPKLVYVTYDHNDPLYEQYGGHPEQDEDPSIWKPTYVRVYLIETLIVHDLDAGETHQSGPTIYKGTEVSCVEWTLGATVKTVAQWKAEWAVTPSAMNGPFWILDTDGWLYWAEPLRHGESTDPILEAIKLTFLDDNEDIDYSIDVQMEAIDFGLRDFEKWRDPNESTNPTMGIGIRPLFGLTDFGIDENGNTIALPTSLIASGIASSSNVFIDGINIYAGGANNVGQLSDGTKVARPYPVQMMWDETTPMTQRNVMDIRQANRFFYIQKSDGTWWGVGYNSGGNLSNGTFADASFPVPMMWDAVTPMDATNVTKILPGVYHAFILRDDGAWFAVGRGNNGVLSYGSNANQSYPVQMEWSSGVPILNADLDEFVGTGYNGYMLKKSDNTWYGVGWNNAGQLSVGTTAATLYPLAMKWDAGTTIDGSNSILFSESGVVIHKADGTYWAAGGNADNLLCDGTTTNRSYPVQMLWGAGQPMTDANVLDMAFDTFSMYVLKSDNVWYAQGANNRGQLARGYLDAGAIDRYPEPAMWDGSNPMTRANLVTVHGYTNGFRLQKPDGSWWGIGQNDEGQLVNGTLVNPTWPTPMLWATGAQIGLAT